MNTDLCCGCEACSNVCPVDAIKMVEDREGFPYPKIDKKKCIHCGQCDSVCPMSEKCKESGVNKLYFGAMAKDDKLRFESSSGGVFPVMAQHILANGGVVFGACLCDNGEVKHICVSKPEELALLQKTKYVQSEIGDSFRQVKKFLEKGISVLFTGTPCQCRGLQLFLGKDYENLLIADLICYGVPSPGIWRKYLKYLERKHNGKPQSFLFRDKRNKDRGHAVSYTANGKEHICHLNHDLYCKKYYKNEIIRPSCHSCNFCTPERSSDITIGDFWEIEKRKPELDDGMGASVVILHSEKGKKMWQSISESLLTFACTEEEAMQPRLCSPTQPSPKRKIKMLIYRFAPFSVWIRR